MRRKVRSLFNAMTGARQHVGNYPGVTVERKEGLWKYAAKRFRIVDLPETYSVTAYSIEERIARDFVQKETPDVVEQFEVARETVETIQIFDEKKEEVLITIDNQEAEVDLNTSLAGRIGYAMEPVIQTMGFDWKIGTVLMGAWRPRKCWWRS